MNLKHCIRTIQDFPKKGINFFDITTLVKDKDALAYAVDLLYEKYKNTKIDKIISPESRGFIFGVPLAYKLNCGFILARKSGKLPAETISERYSLEYGSDSIEIHKDAISKSEKVLIVDDLLATGGTIKALINLVNKLEGDVVGISFLIELAFLNGRDALKGYDLFSLLTYENE